MAKFKPNEPQQSSSTCIGSPGSSLSGSDKRVLTPEEVRPYPKAQLRKKSKQGRKKGRTCVLTDRPTPEKDRVEQEMKIRKENQDAKIVRSKKFKRMFSEYPKQKEEKKVRPGKQKILQ